MTQSLHGQNPSRRGTYASSNARAETTGYTEPSMAAPDSPPYRHSSNSTSASQHYPDAGGPSIRPTDGMSKKASDPPQPSWKNALATVVKSSYLNVLLIFVVLTILFYYCLKHVTFNGKDIFVFVSACLAIIPLAKLLAMGTDELSKSIGETSAGILNATLGNAVELIVAILAVVHCELRIVQSSLIGSILSNILLVLGMSFFYGGTKFSEQKFDQTTSQLTASLLVLAVIGLILPNAYNFTTAESINNNAKEAADILKVSRATAILLLFSYVLYLVFQMYTHKHLFEENKLSAAGQSVRYTGPGWRSRWGKRTQNMILPETKAHKGTDAESEGPPELTRVQAFVLLAVVTALVGLLSEALVDSIDGLTASGAISKEFVGLIILPIIGNAAEHATAVISAGKDKITLSINVALGSSLQIALFVIPFIVLLAWMIGKPLSMLFDPFEVIMVFLSVLVVNSCIQDGSSNWLEGAVLMILYLILAVVFWFYPGSEQIRELTCGAERQAANVIARASGF